MLLQYNDYKKQEKNKPAPKAIKLLDPLVAIHQIMKHVLPPNFQKVRNFGIMTSSQLKKIHINVPGLVKENKHTIRTLFQIVKALLQLEDTEEIVCKACGSTEMTREPIAPDNEWYEVHIRKNRNQIKNKSPDSKEETILTNSPSLHLKGPALAMEKIKEKA